jgi:UDP-N-acetyl-D-glucosamine dehydrogenase
MSSPSSREIANTIRKTQGVLESTTYPGTNEEQIKPKLEQGSGILCGRDFYLASLLNGSIGKT